MTDDWHLRKCRDCDNRVKDVDPTNIAFQGMSYCRAGPPGLMFIAGMGHNKSIMAQPVGSHYPIVDENTAACRLFEPNGGNIRRNIVKTIPQSPAETPSGKLS